MFYRLFFWVLFPVLTWAQNSVSGTFVDENNSPVPFVKITFTESNQVIYSDNLGEASFIQGGDAKILVEVVGYKKVEAVQNFSKDFTFYLEKTTSETQIETVIIKKGQSSLRRPVKAVTNTIHLSQNELKKAACCNLSESFETNPSIDVSSSDAVTGNRQIKMLGLNSPYILMTEENAPAIRGAMAANGLSFIPGTWVESIQITKGMGSVINGFESVSGQINYELLKPEKEDPFFVNLYGSNDGRYELNTHFGKKYNDKLSSLVLLHGSTRNQKMDMNHDHFLDNPVGKQVNLLNRWQYHNKETGFISFLNLKYFKDYKQGGQEHFDPEHENGMLDWGSKMETEKIEISNKTGFVMPNKPFESIGLQQAFQYNKTHSYIGDKIHHMHHKNYFANLLFNSIINNTKNKFITGLNFNMDLYEEHLDVNMVKTVFDRKDNSVGAFFEYSFDNLNNFNLTIGNRVDLHNRLGLFYTPRIHAKYSPLEKTTIRISAGRGKRAANILAENINLLASSRQIIIKNEGGKLYGLDPEIAWNFGGSLSQKVKFLGKENEFILDYYNTIFDNQVVIDMENPRELQFSNLNGKSYAESIQLEWNINFMTHLDLRMAYKYLNVKTNYQTGLLQKPFQAQNRFFVNIAYETHILKKGQQWKFDATYNWIGQQRLPSTTANPVAYQRPDFVNPFSLVNTQITRTFSSVFEVYLGGENIFNYQQKNAIIDYENPFGTYFDSTMIYAPVFGRMVYAGLRFKIK